MSLRVLKEIVRQRRRQLILLGCLLLVATAVYLLRVSVLQEKLVDARRDWAQQRTQLKQKTMQGKAELYDTAQLDFAKFTSRIPDKKEFARVIGELFEYADNNSLSIGSVSYKPVKTINGYLEYQINIDVTGRYGEIKSFLTDINQAKEIITVDEVKFNKGGKLFDDEVTMRAILTVLFGAKE